MIARARHTNNMSELFKCSLLLPAMQNVLCTHSHTICSPTLTNSAQGIGSSINQLCAPKTNRTREQIKLGPTFYLFLSVCLNTTTTTGAIDVGGKFVILPRLLGKITNWRPHTHNNNNNNKTPLDRQATLENSLEHLSCEKVPQQQSDRQTKHRPREYYLFAAVRSMRPPLRTTTTLTSPVGHACGQRRRICISRSLSLSFWFSRHLR